MAPQIVIMTEAEVEKFEKEEGVGAMLTEKGPLPLKALDVQARLEGLIGEVSLTQVFVNTHAEPLEATYIFPLPDRAAVTQFRMEVAGRIVEGVLKERGAARQEYDEAIQAGHRAAITEEERPGVFTMRVGNLPPGEAATVKLTLVGPLVFDSGEVTFRFPLVVAPRYIPGVPLDGRSVGDGVALDTSAVPDASRITPHVLLPGYPNPVRFSMNIDVQPSGLPLSNFHSSLHAVASEPLPGGATKITIQPGERLNRDVILRYRIAEESIQSSLTLSPDAEGNEGTYLLTIVPPLADSRKPIADSRPRDIVFVLDRSGSMDGWKMVAARRALGRMIDTLTEKDRFTVLAFDDVFEIPTECGENLAVASNRTRYRVIEWLASIEARNGTEMAQPLAWGVEHLTDA
ncbi:MAG TPA: VIT domain-containing protein, partial [Gemmataceae bacterium]|nr:VIT domain-containing protein [Gemmataceae bacterium]